MSAEGWQPRRRRADPRGVRPLLVVGFVLLITGLILAPAHAATDPLAHSQHHGSPGVWIGLALVALAALRLTRATRCGGDAAILSLALVVALFGIESAVHSVHHLSDPDAAASCAMFSASQHAPGAGAETPHEGAPTWTAEPAPVLAEEHTHPLPTFRSHEGRAPPALPSV